MFEQPEVLENAESRSWPRPERAGGTRRALLRGIRRLGAWVAAVHSPRAVRLEAAHDRSSRSTAWEAVQSFPRLESGEERGAGLLRQVAEELREATGHGVGDGVCLATALVLETHRSLEEGLSRGTLTGLLEEARERLLAGLDEAARPAGPEEVQTLLLEGLDSSWNGGTPEAPDHTFLVPGRLPGAEAHQLEGVFVTTAPQAVASLPPNGSWEGPHRVLHLTAPLRTLSELRKLFGALARFTDPLLVLAPRVSPSVGTGATSLSREGRLPGHLLWLDDEEPDERLQAIVQRGLPEPCASLEEALALDPETLPVSGRTLWVEGGALLELPGSGGLRFSALSLGTDVREGPGLGRTLRLLEAVRQRGMVSGGGGAYLALGRTVSLPESSSFLLRSLEAPARALLENEGMDAETVLDRLRSLPPGAGYDVLERRFFLSVEEGPATPVPVVEEVLQAAFRAALESLELAFAPEEENLEGGIQT